MYAALIFNATDKLVAARLANTEADVIPALCKAVGATPNVQGGTCIVVPARKGEPLALVADRGRLALIRQANRQAA